MAYDPTFDEQQAAWRAYTSSPWGRIRYAVVRRTLSASIRAVDRPVAVDVAGPGPRRVLDVGGGDGLDSLALAEDGHDVTVLDPSEPMLAAAAAEASSRGVPVRTVHGGLEDLHGLGQYDVVLCHFVLQYRPHDAADFATLAAAVRPGGLISVVLPNPAGRVLATLVRQGPVAALEESSRDVSHTVTFDREVRKITVEEATDGLEQAGMRIVGLFGGRIANDLLTDDELKQDQGYYDDLLALELALCDQDPYRRIGAFYQLVATRD